MIGLPIASILVSEGFLYVGFIGYVLLGHLVTLSLCAVLPLYFRSQSQPFLALALLPLFRLVNLGMPVFVESPLYTFALLYVPLLPALLLIGVKHEAVAIRSRPAPTRVLAFLPLAVIVSFLLAEIEYSILHPEALIPTLEWVHLLSLSVVMIGVVAVVEELLFRGILQRTLEDRLGPFSGLILTSVLFAAMHASFGIPAEIAFAGGIGLLFGAIYDRTDRLSFVIIVHGLMNVFLFGVIPIRGSLLPL